MTLVAAAVSRYFSDLGPIRAFFLFTMATVGGAVSLWLDFFLPLAPIILVSLYGVILSLAQTRYLTQLSSFTKDSPYFLGFILTLVALVFIFWDLSGPDTRGEQFVSSLFDGSAAALGTTVAGLIFRQWIHASDRSEDDRDEIFQTMARELKEHTTRFATSQRRLVTLIGEFTDSRETMFRQEEEVFSEYIRRLGDATSSMSRLETEYADRSNDAVKAMTLSSERAAQTAEDSAKQLDASRVALEQLMDTYEKTAQASSGRHDALIEQTRAGLAESGERLNDVTGRLVETVAGAMTRLGEIPSHHAETVGSITTAANELTMPLKGIHGDLEVLRTGIEGLADELRGLPQKLMSSVEHLDRLMAKREQVVGERLRGVVEDIEALDAILDQLTELLERRIAGRGR